MPKLKPLSEFSLTWTEEDYDHEKATKFIHSLLGQIENLEEKNTTLNEAVTEAKKGQTAAERALSKAKAGDSEELVELKNANADLQKKLDEFDVKGSPEYLRLEVAVTKELDAFAAERLRGNTRDEIEADADAWIERGYGKAAAGSEDDEDEVDFDEPSVLAGRPQPKTPTTRTGGSKPSSDMPTADDWKRWEANRNAGIFGVEVQ